MTTNGIAAALLCTIAAYRFNFHSEADLQAGIAQALDELGITYQREVCLLGASREDCSPQELGRIDFLVGTVGVEVKVDGTLNAVIRQVHRYMQCDQISALMLITSKARHRLISGEINGKPVYVTQVGGGI